MNEIRIRLQKCCEFNFQTFLLCEFESARHGVKLHSFSGLKAPASSPLFEAAPPSAIGCQPRSHFVRECRLRAPREAWPGGRSRTWRRARGRRPWPRSAPPTREHHRSRQGCRFASARHQRLNLVSQKARQPTKQRIRDLDRQTC